MLQLRFKLRRNGNTGGDDSKFEEMMQEAGLGDGFTPPKIHVPKSCEGCPMLGLEVKGWEDIVDGVKETREMILKAEGGVFVDIARQPPSGKMDALDLDGIAKKMQARINRMTEGCRGVVTLSGESDRTGKVLGVSCGSPVYNPEPGGTTSNKIVAVTREDSQKTKEYGESDNPSGE